LVQYTADDIPYGTYLLYRAHNQDKLRSGYVANYTQSVFSTALAVKSNKIWSEISSTSSGFDKNNGPGVVFAGSPKRSQVWLKAFWLKDERSQKSPKSCSSIHTSPSTLPLSCCLLRPPLGLSVDGDPDVPPPLVCVRGVVGLRSWFPFFGFRIKGRYQQSAPPPLVRHVIPALVAC